MLQVLVHSSEVVTGAGIRKKDGRRVLGEDMGRIPDGAVVCSRGRIEWVGPTSELPRRYSRKKKRDLRGEKAIIPGMVDCHTHAVFAGNRSHEFAARCAGATYAEIAARGGGILTTVRATREASIAELERLAAKRLREMAHYGVRTIEIKSGYGLSMEAELKILKVVGRLRKRLPGLTLVPTFLGAHAFPPEKPREEYLRELHDVMLPLVAKEKLADACDVFIDSGYFTRDEGRDLLLHARDLGMRIKVHADELTNTESAALASELGCLSADHLLRISEDGIRKLADSETVAVLLPGTAFYLKAEHAPARRLLDAGVAVALSTDFNPGTSMCLSLPAVMTIAALYLGMSAAEIFAAVTYNGAKALDLHHRKGTLEPGRDADLAVLPFKTFEETYYRFAWR